MRYYKAKDVIVEAEQWTPGILIEGVYPLATLSMNHQAFIEKDKIFKGQNVPLSEVAWVEAPDGGHLVLPGDWIVTWINGQKYPVKPGDFKIAFELYNLIEDQKDEGISGPST